MVTVKEPTAPEFKDFEGGNLVGWVYEKIMKGQAVDVLASALLDADSKLVMLQVLQIAAACLSDNPSSRPTMFNVLKVIKGISKE